MRRRSPARSGRHTWHESAVQAVSNVDALGLRSGGLIGAIGQVLQQRPTGVLAGAARARAVVVDEEHTNDFTSQFYRH